MPASAPRSTMVRDLPDQRRMQRLDVRQGLQKPRILDVFGAQQARKPGIGQEVPEGEPHQPVHRLDRSELVELTAPARRGGSPDRRRAAPPGRGLPCCRNSGRAAACWPRPGPRSHRPARPRSRARQIRRAPATRIAALVFSELRARLGATAGSASWSMSPRVRTRRLPRAHVARNNSAATG